VNDGYLTSKSGAMVLAGLCVSLLLAACGDPQERSAEYLQRAQALYDQGDYVKAKLEAQNAAQIEPKNAQAHYLLAQIAEQQQDFRPMIQRLMTAVNADPQLVPARVKLGTLYFFAQAYEQAAEQAEAAAGLAPDDPDVHVLNARVRFQKEDREGGVRELDAALAKDPDHVDALLLRASAYAIEDAGKGIEFLDSAIARLDSEKTKPLRQVRIVILAQQKRIGEVEEAYRQLIRDFPQDEEFQYQLARFYASQGRVDEAEEVMRSVVSMDPADVNARLGLAQFLAQMRSPEAAEQALEAFVAESPEQPELRFALGQLYEANQKPDAALPVYQELAERSPKSKEGLSARVRIVALQINKGQLDEGRAGIEAILTDQPDHADALLIRAGLRVRDQKFDEAVADVRTVLRKEPQNARAMLLLARTHALMNDRVLAKDAYRRLLEADPRNAEAPRELAQLELADRNLTGAEELLRKRLGIEPGDLDASSRLVEVLVAQKAFGEAEQEARRMAELPDDKGFGDFQLGRVLRAQKKNAEAADAFRRSLDQNPEWIFPLEGLVASLTDLGRREEATKVLQEHLKRKPDNLAVKFLQGGVYARQGDRAAAAKIFEEIVAAKPDASMAWAAMAGMNPDDPAKRIEAYQRGLAVNPGNAELGMLLGTEYERAGKFDEAITHYEQLLAANPKLDLAANNLASLLLDHRTDRPSHVRALELARRFESATNPPLLDTVGWAYYRTGDYPRAVQYLERAVAGAGIPLLRYHLGMAYLANNNTAGARQELSQAVAQAKADFPGIEEARRTLKQLEAS
jgi:tetratricopeptide (TPR) repeat protein